MKRLIALLIAILTMLLGGVRQTEVETTISETAPAEVEITAPETSRPEVEPTVKGTVETESDAGSSTEKENGEQVSETDTNETGEPCIFKTEPQQSTDSIIPSFQHTDPGMAAEEKTAMVTELPVKEDQPVSSLPAPKPTAEDTTSVPDEKEAEKVPETEPPASGNAPVFIDPCRGGPNPFADGTPTEIDEHSSDEFIGDGDRPGEGIHF